MSAQLYSASANDGSVQGTTVGGSKPLHRFIKGQPKIIGIVVLVLGTSFFTVSIAIMRVSYQYMWTVIPPGFFLGVLFIICGIMYVVADHNPTKKTVTISLALSIVSLLAACWTILHIAPSIAHSHSYRRYDFPEYVEDNGTETITEESWSSYSEAMGVCVEAIYLFYSVVGAIIFIVMSTLAGGALRSTNSQAIVVMTTEVIETPVELQAAEEVRRIEQKEEI